MTMTDTKGPSKSPPTLDRPSEMVSSVDKPWEPQGERAHRVSTLDGDKTRHRMFHSLYEDMLS